MYRHNQSCARIPPFTVIYEVINEFNDNYTIQKYTYICMLHSHQVTLHTKVFPHLLTWAISSFSTPSVKPRCSSALISRPSLYHSAEVSFFMLPTWKAAQKRNVGNVTVNMSIFVFKKKKRLFVQQWCLTLHFSTTQHSGVTSQLMYSMKWGPAANTAGKNGNHV